MRTSQYLLVLSVCGVLSLAIGHAGPVDSATAVSVPVVSHVYSVSPAKPVMSGVAGARGLNHSSSIQPAGPLLNKAPDHGTTQPVISGQTVSKIKTTAAITGTGLNRKP